MRIWVAVAIAVLAGAGGAGAAVFNLTNNPQSYWAPTWSPDDSQIAYVAGVKNVHIVDRDGTDDKRLAWQTEDERLLSLMRVSGRTEVADVFKGVYGIDWSPDGRRLALAATLHPVVETCAACNTDPAGIFVVDVSGANLTWVLAAEGNQNYYPKWSPDGGKIAFGQMGRIYTMNADGSQVEPLVAGPAFAPCWFADGRRLAYIAQEEQGDPLSNEIYVVDADGGNKTRVTHNRKSDFLPAPTPDGLGIMHLSWREGWDGFAIYTADLASGRVRLRDPLPQSRTMVGSPFGRMVKWSSDRRHIVYAGESPAGQGGSDIFIKDLGVVPTVAEYLPWGRLKARWPQ